MTPQKLTLIGLRTALVSFAIGGLIFLFYYLSGYNAIIYLEYLFIFVAAAINLIILLRILNYASKHKRGKRPLYFTGSLIVVSMLVLLVLFKIMTNLLDTMRINFVNATGYELSDVKITGCQKKYMDNIKSGGSETVWIRIKRDCSIEISYTENGQPKKEMISEYVTRSMGQKLTYTLKN